MHRVSPASCSLAFVSPLKKRPFGVVPMGDRAAQPSAIAGSTLLAQWDCRAIGAGARSSWIDCYGDGARFDLGRSVGQAATLGGAAVAFASMADKMRDSVCSTAW